MLDILRHTPATCPKTVALTFDDGPSPYTMQVLEILDLHGAYATFFVTGAHVAGRPEVARAIVAAGHAVGNHTYTHPQDVPGSQPRGAFDLLPEPIQADQEVRAPGRPRRAGAAGPSRQSPGT
jgi:peptidoglycan/xylan/chitin deacetylase (PgdA/CDA1 family)